MDGNNRIRIAAVGLDTNMFWQGVVRLLEADGTMEVPHLDSLQEMPCGVEVAIVPWSRSSDGHPWLDRLGSPHCRAVIGIDDLSNEAILWAQQIGPDTLLGMPSLFGSSTTADERDAANGINIIARSGNFDDQSYGFVATIRDNDEEAFIGVEHPRRISVGRAPDSKPR